MPFRIYKDDTVVVEGDSPLEIDGCNPNTDIASGEYEVTRLENEQESERVPLGAWKTLPIVPSGVTLSPKTSSAAAGTAGNRQLSSTVAPVNATNKGVSYAIAPVTTGLAVNTSGNITWTEAVPAGEYTTTVTTTSGAKKDTHVLTLTEPETPEEPETEE